MSHRCPGGMSSHGITPNHTAPSEAKFWFGNSEKPTRKSQTIHTQFFLRSKNGSRKERWKGKITLQMGLEEGITTVDLLDMMPEDRLWRGGSPRRRSWASTLRGSSPIFPGGAESFIEWLSLWIPTICFKHLRTDFVHFWEGRQYAKSEGKMDEWSFWVFLLLYKAHTWVEILRISEVVYILDWRFTVWHQKHINHKSQIIYHMLMHPISAKLFTFFNICKKS